MLRPPAERDLMRTRIRRMLTWEDSLSPHAMMPPAFFPYWGARENLTSVLQCTRGSEYCKETSCGFWPLPTTVKTHTRPNSAFVVRLPNGVQHTILDIPKVATTTIMHFLHDPKNPFRPYTQDKESKDLLNSCKGRSYLDIVDEAVRLSSHGQSSNSSSPFRLNLEVLASCAFGATFNLEDQRDHHNCVARGCRATNSTFNLALVRHPFGRFITALCPHNQISEDNLCNMRTYALGYARPRLPLIELLAWRARTMRFQIAYADDAHVRTQSYFLTSTDRSGNPIRWDAILRLEDASFSQQLSDIFQGMLTDVGMSYEDARITGMSWSKSRANSKLNAKAIYRQLAIEAEAHPSFLCDLCHIYGQDFACLGFAFPAQCRESKCLSSMPRWLQIAVKRNVTV